jgi:NTP pyrophosphatase (non-canonical NTP hydrolase)
MDTITTISELKSKVQSFCDERASDTAWNERHTPKDVSIGIITEAAELLEHFRYKSMEEAEEMLKCPIKKEAITEELADVFYGVLRFSQRFDVDLTIALTDKLKKNERKYPVNKNV